jgi:hypothetical protein
MVVPIYTYLKLKMPDPKGVITVEGSFEQAYYYKLDYVAQVIVLITPVLPMALAATHEGRQWRKQPRQQWCSTNQASAR